MHILRATSSAVTWVTTTTMLALGVGACTGAGLPGGTSSSSSSSSGGVSTPQLVQDFQSFLFAVCAYHERCQSVHGPAFSSVDACKARVQRDVLVGLKALEDQALVYKTDPEAYERCLTSLATAACTSNLLELMVACQDAMTPRTPKGPGESCTSALQSGAARCRGTTVNFCNLDQSGTGCGVCAAKRANNDPCQSNDECQSGFCNTVLGANRCQAIPSGKGLGQGCLITLECGGNLTCAGPLLGRTCTARAGLGQSCTSGNEGNAPQCAQDLYCAPGSGGTGTCAEPRSAGASCTRDPAANQVPCREFCTFPTADAPTGTCAVLETLPGSGQPCALVADGNALTPRCDSHGDLYVDDWTTATRPGTAPGCTCWPRQAGSASCFKDDACQSRHCDGRSGNAPGTCRALAADGAACTADSDCLSTNCQVISGQSRCAPVASCG